VDGVGDAVKRVADDAVTPLYTGCLQCFDDYVSYPLTHVGISRAAVSTLSTDAAPSGFPLYPNRQEHLCSSGSLTPPQSSLWTEHVFTGVFGCRRWGQNASVELSWHVGWDADRTEAHRGERFRELVAWYMLQGLDEAAARRQAHDEIDDDPRKD
jgi:hypothetical protein